MKQIPYILILIIATSQVQALEFKHSEKIADIFHDAGVSGTFVLYDVTEQKLVGYNHKRAEKKFPPASTFKIVNSLIGLSIGIVNNVEEIFYFHDGTPKFLQSWEQDTNLRDAFRTSNVPAYQELARRIGLETMQSNITKLEFGSVKIGNSVDKFWLDGSLTISAVQQVLFLGKLAQKQLFFSPEIQEAVQQISKLETKSDWELYGKTGWATQGLNPTIGWFVGWVRKNGKLYSFALNMDIHQDHELPKRVEIARLSLQVLEVL